MMFRVSFKGLRKFCIQAPSLERAKEWSERQLAYWREDKATPTEINEYDPKAEAAAEKAAVRDEKKQKQKKAGSPSEEPAKSGKA